MEFLPDSGHAVPRKIRRDNEQTTPPEPHTGLQDADAADGDRGALSPSAHDEAGAGT